MVVVLVQLTLIVLILLATVAANHRMLNVTPDRIQIPRRRWRYV